MLTWVLDRRGAIIFRSPEWADYTGIQEPDPRVRLRSQGIHPDDFARVERVVDDAMAIKTPFMTTYRLKRADQTYGWVVTGGSPVFSTVDGEFVGYLGTTHETSQPADETGQARAVPSPIVLNAMAAQIMTVRSLAKQHSHQAIVKILDLALLLTGDLLAHSLRRP